VDTVDACVTLALYRRAFFDETVELGTLLCAVVEQTKSIVSMCAASRTHGTEGENNSAQWGGAFERWHRKISLQRSIMSWHMPGAVIAASSRGGLAASHCSFYHPDVVGNVLSQSGAFWVRNDDTNPPPWPITLDTGDLVLTVRNSPRVPIKFYMEVGRFDSLLDINREFRDVLLLKGYRVTYREFDGGHDYFYWRGSLADTLISLISQNRDH
jgi:hypothetical protein